MTTIDDHELDIHSKNLNRFIAKLYRIVNSDEPTVRWVPGGKRFLILDPKKFAETVLPKYFKHSKFTSFVRQLNFYGFHKKRIVSTDLEKNDEDDKSPNSKKLENLGDMVCFQHHFFQAKQPELLHRIQRTTKQTAAAAIAESESLSKQKEIEEMQAQLREMKKHMETSRDEFDLKLAAARAEIELDYLHRIQAIEVCYKDLVKMILPNKQLSDFPLPSLKETRFAPGPNVTGAFPSVSRSSSTGSRGAVNRTNNATTSILLGQNYTPRDFLVDQQKLDMISPLQQINGSRRGLFGDLGPKAGTINVDALVGAAQQRLLPKNKEMLFAKHGVDASKMKEVMAGRASLTEMLRRNRQMLAAFTTGNAAA